MVTEQDQAKVWTLALGGAGAVVSLGFRRKLNALKAILSVVGGTATAYVGAPIINNIVPAHSQETLAAVAFFAGLGGMKFCEALYRFMERRGDSLIEQAAGKFLPKPPDANTDGETDSNKADIDKEKSEGEEEK